MRSALCADMGKFAFAAIAFAILLTFISMRYLAVQDFLVNQDLIKENEYLQHAIEVANAKARQALAESKTHFVPPSPPVEPLEKSCGYVFYAASDINACSILVNIYRMQHELDTAMPIHVLAGPEISDDYVKALENTKASIHTKIPQVKGLNASNDRDSLMLKLSTFNMHSLDPGLKRILALDGDQLILKNLDHLFEQSPEANISAPRSYWMPSEFLASTFMVVNLSNDLLKIAENVLESLAFQKFDLNLLSDSVERVAVLSGQYVTLNSHWGDWNLPRWFQPSQEINMTTVELVNELSKGQSVDIPQMRRSDMNIEESSTTSEGDDGPTTESTTANSVARAVLPSAPRFPEKHPITIELHLLHQAAAVIHFTQKPWTYTADVISNTWPDAHPRLVGQIRMWRQIAAKVCPGGIPDAPGL